MKKIICLWAGPGCGKSTTAAKLFGFLKDKGYNAEMNREYVKEWVWEERKILPGDQVFITANQARKETIYMRQNLTIVTDSPLALAVFYGDMYDKYESQTHACRAIVAQHHVMCKDLGYKVDHFFLVRQKAYNPSGRLQTEQEAIEYDSKIKQFLDSYPIKYKTIICDENVVENIYKEIKK